MRITAVIPTIPPHMGPGNLYERAFASISAQTYPVERIAVALDANREGAAATRNKALELVETEWVAFLDSDDEWYPDHLRKLARCARLTGADVVYPGYDCTGDDPVNCFGIPFDPELLRRRNFIPVTVLAKTELVREVGGFQPHPDEHGDPCEDWGLWLALLDAGATFMHLPQKTWLWHNAEQTTKGRPDRW